LKYGENPHQQSYLLKDNDFDSSFGKIIDKKEISYNNLLDTDAAINCVKEFNEPTCIIIKHNNPCAVASGKNIYDAFVKAYKSDPISSFGGIVCLNRIINYKLAKKLRSYFFEIIVAKKFNKESLAVLNKKKRPLLVQLPVKMKKAQIETKSINGGILKQNKNSIMLNSKKFHCVSKLKASKKTLEDLIFAMKVCKHVKSNAIVLVKNKKTIGIGAGQMSRIDATRIALLKTSKINKNAGFVAASDAFFPFTDSLKLLISNNCKSVIQPSGSLNDIKNIRYANNHKISLYFMKYRFFKH